MTKQKSVIFNKQEVIATLEGRKKQFRRVCGIQPEPKSEYMFPQLISSKIFQVGDEILIKGHQPKLTLKIKNIRVERLQDISEEDAEHEGMKADWRMSCVGRRAISRFGLNFINFWNSTHKKPSEKWEANPFVWVVDFEVIN